MGTTPLHHPDEDLQNFQMGSTNSNANVYLPNQMRQMNFGAAPSTPAPPPLLQMPQTPVRYEKSILINFN